MCGSKLQSISDSRQRKRDGKYLRYYMCYYRKPSNAAEDGRETCVLPYIPADEFELKVWNLLIMTLTMNVSKDKLVGTAQWNEKESRVILKIKSLENSLSASKLAKQRLEELLKKAGQFDFDAFLEMNAKFDREITQFQLELREAQEELNNLRQLRQEEEKLIQFANDRKDLLQRVEEILNSLPFKEKQRFIKGMLAAPVSIGQDWDRLERTGTTKQPPEHWSEGLFVPFRFNWPLLQDILSRYLPPTPDGTNGGNTNVSPHRSPLGQIRAVARGRRIGKVCGCARAGAAGTADSVEAASRRGGLLKFTDEAETPEEILPARRRRTVDPGPRGHAAGPFRTRISPDIEGRKNDSRPGSSGEHPFRSPA